MIKLWWHRRQLQRQKFTIVRNFMSKEMIEVCKTFLDVGYTRNLLYKEDDPGYLFGTAFRSRPNPFDDTILLYYQKEAEKYFNQPLVPSYLIFREYAKDSWLKIHRDKDTCEFSVSLTVHKRGEGRNPLVFYSDEQGNDPIEVDTEEGDAVFFHGATLYNGAYHSRAPVQSDSLVQAFLHYVSPGNRAEESFPLPFFRKA